MLYGRWRCFGFLYITGNIDISLVNKAYSPPSFDATYLYQYSFIMLYNLLFTSLPVAVLGGKLSEVDLRSFL
jgi:magnesium-transporting ATPase (P-type)